MRKSLRVFLCSTFVDLVEERRRVQEAIQFLQLQHDSMEFFGARPDSPLQTCLEEVRRSDILVVVVGHRYGSLIPGSPLSFAVAEYEEGIRLGKPCLVYLVDDNVPVLPRNTESDPKGIRRLRRWKEALQRRHTVARFRDGSHLAVQVAADLGRRLELFEASESAPNDAQGQNRTREALRAFTEVTVEGRELPEVAQRLREIVGVVEVMLVFGYVDMMVLTSAVDLDDLLATLDDIGRTLGVTKAETLIVVNSATAPFE
jgi:DNA-binding Lrp family transcriptional regulator